MLVKNCKILDKGIEKIVDILIENEKIVKIDKNIDRCDDTEVIDANKNFVLPGIVDLHTHMRDPGLSQKEDYTTGSMACAKGGVTTFVDMPNTVPAVITEKILDEKKEILKGKSYVDYGFNFGGSKNDNSSEICKVVDKVVATKIFLNVSTGDMLVTDENAIVNIFKNSKIVAVHAEGEMVKKAIEFAKKYNKPLYLCHLSTEEEVNFVREAKKEGLEVYAEVTPHHLFLNDSDVNRNEKSKMLLRTKPELKTKKDNEALWEGLKDGTIDTIGTDHAPHLIEEKLKKLTFGMPSVENSLEMMLKGVKENKITLQRLIEVMCTSPAKIMKIKNKGKLEVGYDGDLVIVDINDSTKIDKESLVTKANWTPYEGVVRGGKVLTTILRGKKIYSDNKFYGINGREISYE